MEFKDFMLIIVVGFFPVINICLIVIFSLNIFEDYIEIDVSNLANKIFFIKTKDKERKNQDKWDF